MTLARGAQRRADRPGAVAAAIGDWGDGDIDVLGED